MLWLYKLGLDGASIVQAWPAFKLKSDYRQHEQVHPGMFVCLEIAGIGLAPVWVWFDVDHYIVTATRTQLISTQRMFEATPVCDK